MQKSLMYTMPAKCRNSQRLYNNEIIKNGLIAKRFAKKVYCFFRMSFDIFL